MNNTGVTSVNYLKISVAVFLEVVHIKETNMSSQNQLT